MDDAVLVRGLERLGDLARDRERLGERQRPARDARREVVALDELHHERADAARLLDAVDGGDVRVIERGEQLGLALKRARRSGSRRTRRAGP